MVDAELDAEATAMVDAELDAGVRRLAARALGATAVEVEPLVAGLGRRRFFRLRSTAPTGDAPHSLVARLEAPEDPAIRPPGVSPEPALEPLRGWLETHDLPVPRRYGGDPARGVDLLEDLGSRSLDQAVAALPLAEVDALYAEAVGLVPRLQRVPPRREVPAFGRRLDRAMLAFKAGLFARFSLPTALGRAPRPSETAVVEQAFDWIADRVEEAPSRLSHRDYQSQNLMVRSEAGQAPRLAMVDFQGAWMAPPEYDLVCLLRDSYVELPEPTVGALLCGVRPALPDRPDREGFEARFDLLTLSRKGKDHARFLEAARERGDERFLTYLPATVRALCRAAERSRAHDPSLARLAELVCALPERPCVR